MQKVPITNKNLNLITKEEKDAIVAQIQEHASYCVDSVGMSQETAPINDILSPWANSKSSFLSQIFKNQLVLHKTFVLPQEETYFIEREITERLLHYSNPFFNIVQNKLDQKLAEQHSWSDATYRTRLKINELLFSPKSLTTNKVKDDAVLHWFDTPLNGFVIQKGAKVMKTLKKVSELLGIDEQLFEEFRIEHSKIIQNANEEVELSLSIHPLDYITMSDNNNNWNSCMSWVDRGCYRQGTVEMMNSPWVVVGYIASKHKPYYLANGYKWNSKIWRELYVVHPHIISSIMAYPNRNQTLSKAMIDWIKELVEAHTSERYEDTSITFNGRCDLKNKIEDYFNKDVYIDFSTEAMYNDCFRDYQQCYISKTVPQGFSNINYSGVSECMNCGRTVYIEPEGVLLCDKCESMYYCDGCNEWFTRRERNGPYYIEEYTFCENCYQDHFS